MLLPTPSAAVRGQIERWCLSHAISLNVVGEFQDTALMKSFGREGRGAFPVPKAIEREVCRELGCVVLGRAEEIEQRYFLLAVERRLTHPTLAFLYKSAQRGIFG